MEFPKENIIDKTLKEFRKKHPLISLLIRIKVKIEVLCLNLKHILKH